MRFHQYIKKSRVKAGLTQRQVASKLGYTSPQNVSNWERGLALVPMDSFVRLIKMYQIDKREALDVYMNEVIEKKQKRLRLAFKRA